MLSTRIYWQNDNSILLAFAYISKLFFFFNDDNYRLLIRFKFNHAILYTGFINHIIYLNHDNSLDLET